MGVVFRLLATSATPESELTPSIFILLKNYSTRLIFLSEKLSSSVFCRAMFSNFNMHCNHLQGWLNHASLGPTPELLIHKIWSGTREFLFLTRFQMILILLGPGNTLRNLALENLVTGSRLREDNCSPHVIRMVKYRKCKKEEKHMKKCRKPLQQRDGAVCFCMILFKLEECAYLFTSLFSLRIFPHANYVEGRYISYTYTD